MNSDDKKPQSDDPGDSETAQTAAGAPASSVHDAGEQPEEDDKKPEGEAVEETRVEATQVEPPIVQVPRSDGFARFVAVIALLVAVAVLALSQFPQVPQGSAAKVAKLDQRVDAVENRPSDDATASAVLAELKSVETKLSSAETQLSNLSSLSDQLASAESRSADLSLLVDELRTIQSTLLGRIDELEAGASNSQIADLRAKLADLETRIATQEREPAAAAELITGDTADELTAETEARLAEISSSLSSLQEELARLAGQHKSLEGQVRSDVSDVRDQLNADLERRTGELEVRLEELRSATQQSALADQGRMAERAALVLAAGKLKDAAANGASFRGAWDTVTGLGIAASDHPAIDAAADSGIVSLSKLQGSFADAAAEAIVADKVGAGDGWVDGALRRVGSLVKVRRTGELEGDETEAVLARAEQRLQNGDLTSTLAELSTLQGPAADAMNDWVAAATARVSLDTSIQSLQTALISNIGGQN